MTTPSASPFHQNKNYPRPEMFRNLKRLNFSLDSHRLAFVPPIQRQNECPTPARRWTQAFTMVELLTVITVIGILAGLTLGAGGAVRRHSATSQAKSQIAALQTACDRYFSDNNQYPYGGSMPNPATDFNPNTANYQQGGTILFVALFGTNRFDRVPSSKRYFEPKSSMVNSTNSTTTYFIDPWGYPYGYNSDGTNAPLIWSTAGKTTGAADTNKWITSWPKI